MAEAAGEQESRTMPEQRMEHPRPHGDPEPDIAIRKVVGMLTEARKGLDSIGGNRGQVEALRDALYEADAELGYAAWQVGTLKGQLKRERRAKDELEARLAALTEPFHGREPNDNNA